MLSVAHTTTGAFIATQIPNPYISVPLIIATHYILDAVPHWDAGTGLTNGDKSPKQAVKHEIPDLILSAIFVYLIFQAGSPIEFSFKGLAPFWGAGIALIPDFLEAPKNFTKKEPKFLKPHTKFHKLLHHSTPKKLAGLMPQIILLILIIALS